MTVINLPLSFSEPNTKDGLVWKQIIPMNKEIVYGDKKMKFDRPLLESLKASHEAHVFDQTAFQLADDANQHDTPEDLAKDRNWDPQRYRGEVAQLVVDNQNGLMGGFKLTDEGMNLIKKNQKLGVSASIKPDYVDSSGNVHKYVLRHVVGTLNPKIKGMNPWHIALSEKDDENEEVYDLTTTEPAPADTQTPKTGDDDNVTITKTELDKLKADLAEFNNGEALLDEILAEEDDDDVTPNTNLSDNQPAEDPRITALQNDVAKSKWETERERFVNAGVPIGMLNLCDGVMSVHESPTINLSDGESADPREIIRKLLGEAKGTVDLSDEEGHGKTPDERETAKKASEEFADGFINEWINPIF
jgi:hypothetical protein